tara:strand:+ start:169 stop:414 length:246 start_codon:yes stop_codon:yes gene_type:complete
MVSFIPIEVHPQNFEKVIKNPNNTKLIDAKKFSNSDRFLINNGRNNFLLSLKQNRGKTLARINKVFLFIIFLTIFIAVFKN